MSNDRQYILKTYMPLAQTFVIALVTLAQVSAQSPEKIGGERFFIENIEPLLKSH